MLPLNFIQHGGVLNLDRKRDNLFASLNGNDDEFYRLFD
jgi:hypothetical protein